MKGIDAEQYEALRVIRRGWRPMMPICRSHIGEGLLVRGLIVIRQGSIAERIVRPELTELGRYAMMAFEALQ